MHFAFIDFTDRFVSCRALCGLRGAAFLTPPSPHPLKIAPGQSRRGRCRAL
jgi:hypothetical protein